jgi:hypothetical protein
MRFAPRQRLNRRVARCRCDDYGVTLLNNQVLAIFQSRELADAGRDLRRSRSDHDYYYFYIRRKINRKSKAFPENLILVEYTQFVKTARCF